MNNVFYLKYFSCKTSKKREAQMFSIDVKTIAYFSFFNYGIFHLKNPGYFKVDMFKVRKSYMETLEKIRNSVSLYKMYKHISNILFLRMLLDSLLLPLYPDEILFVHNDNFMNKVLMQFKHQQIHTYSL